MSAAPTLGTLEFSWPGQGASRDLDVAELTREKQLPGGSNPKALRTHILRLLGLKTILYKAFGPF